MSVEMNRKGVCLFSEPSQTTDTVFMVSPDHFEFNQETAVSNGFQSNIRKDVDVGSRAMDEFLNMTRVLEAGGVRVITTKSSRYFKTPDAVFPNNWFSVHNTEGSGKILVLYPMLTENRRAERRHLMLGEKLARAGIEISETIDLTHYEAENRILEGTGSLVLDRVNKVAFASVSPRTDREAADDFCRRLGFRPVIFHSRDDNGMLIYHTNVMMSIGTDFCVICSESIASPEREMVLQELADCGKEVVDVSFGQVRKMCCNILELDSMNGGRVIVMSENAYKGFKTHQRKVLGANARLTPVDIGTIEEVGGGSARCMLAEIF